MVNLSFLICKKNNVRNFEKYRLMPNGCQKISKNRIHGCRNSNPKIYKHRILRLTTNKHRFSSRKSTLKTHHSDKSCIPLRVCIKQRDATFSDCLCSRAPIGILFSHIFFTTAYIWDERSNPFDFHAKGFDPSIAQDNNDTFICRK